jgi:hypothetical protein
MEYRPLGRTGVNLNPAGTSYGGRVLAPALRRW